MVDSIEGLGEIKINAMNRRVVWSDRPEMRNLQKLGRGGTTSRETMLVRIDEEVSHVEGGDR